MALANAAIKQGWSYILLVYSDDNVGISKDLKDTEKKQGICFTDKFKVQTNPAYRQLYYGVVFTFNGGATLNAI